MSKSTQNTIARRTFLQGAASVVGASALGMSPVSALAGTPTLTAKPTPSVGFFDGNKLIAADSVHQGDDTLDQVTVEITHYGPSGTLKSIDSHVLVADQGKVIRAPFQAWTAPPQGSKGTRFVASTAGGALQLTTNWQSGKELVAIDLKLTLGRESGPKLREGSYVIVPGTVKWPSMAFNPESTTSPLTSVLTGSAPTYGYVVVTVSRP